MEETEVRALSEGPETAENVLGHAPIPALVARYSIPSVVSMLVMGLYNIVDQIFIGHGVGYLGNTATTVAFPVMTLGLAISLLAGVGAASHISLELGRGNSESARNTLANALMMLGALSLALCVLGLCFLKPLLRALGATDAVMPYAVDYTGIILIGLPFAMCVTASSHSIRADGSPRYSMFATLFGAALNTVLDPIFIFVFGMGVKGAAIATVISQICSFILVIYYLQAKAKYVRLSAEDFKLRPALMRKVAGLGSSSFVNQISMFFVTIVLNNSLVYYGARSVYGSEIPLAAVGVVMKIGQILFSFLLGVCLGTQPIIGYNYGAKKYGRVLKTLRLTLSITGTCALLVNILFVAAPELFIGLFGDTNAEFNTFACRALSTYMGCVFASGLQFPSSISFNAMGKPLKAMVLALTRQVITLIPLLLILPLFFGLDGVLYAGPAADITACCVTGFFMLREVRKLMQLRAKGIAARPEPQEI
jgi:putative MATE family efflux protein